MQSVKKLKEVPYLSSDTKPGKLNKTKVGQKVRTKHRFIDWHSKHLVWCYGRKIEGAQYFPNVEIQEQDLESVYFILHSKLSGKMPTGTIGSFGSEDSDDNTGKVIRGLKYVWVSFKLKTDIGAFNFGTYCSERDLVRITKRKKKCQK